MGGIVGENITNCMVSRCINNGKVNGDGYCGGIAGNGGSILKESYNAGEVIGRYGLGGIVGRGKEAQIEDCYNIGTVNGLNSIGGIVGTAYDKISIYNCYNIGNIISSNKQQYGGIIGKVKDDCIENVRNVYYARAMAEGGNEINGVEPKSSDEIKSLTDILGRNWKLDNNNINNGYPILSWQ